MQARLFSKAVGASMKFPVCELQGQGYERCPIDIKVADGKLVILSDALFGPAQENWTVAGWGILKGGETFAGGVLKQPVTVEKGAYFRMNSGDAYLLED